MARHRREGDETQLLVAMHQAARAAELLAANNVGATRSDTFTATGSGTTVNRTGFPCSRFGLQVTGTATQVGTTTWTVVLEGSLDGVTFTTILSHTYPATADGATVWAAAGVVSPCIQFRSRCTALTLGTATNVVAQILGLP